MPERRRLLELAIKGLKAQASEIANEIDLLEKELVLSAKQAGRKIARWIGDAPVGELVPAPPIKKRRRQISRAQRKTHSDAMREYWRKRKARHAGSGTRTSGRRRRGMSAANRKAQSERMKRLWAERRRAKAKK